MSSIALTAPSGVEITGRLRPGFEKILTPEAVAFAVELQRTFGPERQRLLARRAELQARLDQGWKPDFLPETAGIRESDWTVAPLPKDLLDRRVEITGPTDRKMVINALNSGANVFMADFEDANTPTWENLMCTLCPQLSETSSSKLTRSSKSTGTKISRGTYCWSM